MTPLGKTFRVLAVIAWTYGALCVAFLIWYYFAALFYAVGDVRIGAMTFIMGVYGVAAMVAIFGGIGTGFYLLSNYANSESLSSIANGALLLVVMVAGPAACALVLWTTREIVRDFF